MCSFLARSAHQLEFRLHHFELVLLEISSCMATTELGKAFEGVQAVYMGYPNQQSRERNELLPLHPSVRKRKFRFFLKIRRLCRPLTLQVPAMQRILLYCCNW